MTEDWKPMATRREPMAPRDWVDAALVVAAIAVCCYLVGLLVPVAG